MTKAEEFKKRVENGELQFDQIGLLGEDLREVCLVGASMKAAILSQCNLRGASFKDVDLREASAQKNSG